jgi:Zn-dependent protease with chaperone function
VRKGFAVGGVAILAVPIFSLVVSAGIGARANPFLWKMATVLLGVTILVPGVFATLALVLGRRRELLARFLPWVVRPTMLGVAAILVLQGVLFVYTLFHLVVAMGTGGALVFWGAVAGFALAGAAFVIAVEAFRPWQPEPLPVIGVELGSTWLPELTARVARVAGTLNVRPPARIVIGLDVAAFVTALPINLRGHGLLPAGETLYLPACALRALDRAQLDAVIGHELAHFRGADLAFTERFLPGFVALRNAIENVSPDELDHSDISAVGRLAKIPAQLLMQSIAMTLVLAVNRIRREREFEADRLGAEVASSAALAQALVTFSLLMFSWTTFRSGNAQYLGSGRARQNLCVDYLTSVGSLLTNADRNLIRERVLASHLAHPTDAHPSLHERVRALGFDPDALFERAVDQLRGSPAPGDPGVSLEEAITSIENEWMSIPGTPTVLDTEERLPAELSIANGSRGGAAVA